MGSLLIRKRRRLWRLLLAFEVGGTRRWPLSLSWSQFVAPILSLSEFTLSCSTLGLNVCLSGFFSGETSKTVSFRRAAEFWDRSGGMGGIFRLRSGRIPAVFRRRSGAKWLIFRRSGIFRGKCVVSPDCVLVARMIGWKGRQRRLTKIGSDLLAQLRFQRAQYAGRARCCPRGSGSPFWAGSCFLAVRVKNTTGCFSVNI